MITKRSEALIQIESYKAILDCLFDKPARLLFAKHDLAVIVHGIELVKTTGLKNAPAKRTDTDNKRRTPMLFALKTYDGDLLFLLDDTKVVSIHNGVRFIINEYNVDLRLE
jgi:hypothetical protein